MHSQVTHRGPCLLAPVTCGTSRPGLFGPMAALQGSPYSWDRLSITDGLGTSLIVEVHCSVPIFGPGEAVLHSVASK